MRVLEVAIRCGCYVNVELRRGLQQFNQLRFTRDGNVCR